MSESTGRGEWTRPGVFEVAPGVHRIPLPLPNDGLRAVNVYVLPDDDGLVVIDSGWAIPEARGRGIGGAHREVFSVTRAPSGLSTFTRSAFNWM